MSNVRNHLVVRVKLRVYTFWVGVDLISYLTVWCQTSTCTFVIATGLLTVFSMLVVHVFSILIDTSSALIVLMVSVMITELWVLTNGEMRKHL